MQIPPILLFALMLAPTVEPIRVDGHVPIPMRDGVVLYADIYRPSRDGKFPVLVVRTPYGVQRDGVHEKLIRFARNGYVVVNQDVRGRYESEGQWDPFRNEGRDGYDTIEWAAQQPWSNGKVASEGGSYLGNVQWQMLPLAPPNLVAAFPVLASTSPYHNWAYFGGAFRLAFDYGWAVVRMPNRIMLPQYRHTEAYVPADWKYAALLRHLPLGTGDEASSHQQVRHYREWMKHQNYDDYWRAINTEERFGDIKVPVHTLGGWFDIFLAGTINGYTGMRHSGGSEAARASARMIIGPWGHGPSQKYGEVDFGADAMRSELDIELRWFDRYLKGINNGLDKQAPVELFYMGINQWNNEADWPIPKTRFTPYYLGSMARANGGKGGGQLSPAKPSSRGMVSNEYLYDPNKPVETLGGNNCCGAPTLAGPYDQRPIEARSDVLVFSSEHLKDSLAIAGPVKMKLFASTDGPDTDWVVKLVDVYPSGFAMNIAEGILRARFRQGFDRMEPLKSGEPYEFEVDLVGTANVFQPGHRIRVDITSSNFPQFDRNPNTGEDLGVSDRVRVARQIIFHSPDRPSQIILPVVEGPWEKTSR